MAITKGAKKAIRTSARKTVFNLRTKRTFKKAVKDAEATTGKGREEQNEALKVAYKALDKAAKKGVIKKNTAARKKSRLSQKLKASAK